MANIAKTYTFVNGQPADATQVNKNFDDLIAGVGDVTTLRPTVASLGLDADIVTLALPANTTISAAGAELINDADATAQRETLGAMPSAAGTVTLAQMANMAAASLIYRKTAAVGVPEVQTLATLKADLGSMPASDVSAWAKAAISPAPGMAQLASDIATTSTSLVDATGLSFSVEANKTYLIDAMLGIKHTVSNFTFGLACAGPASPTKLLGLYSRPTVIDQIMAYDTSSHNLLAGASESPWHLHILLVNGANAGTFILRYSAAAGNTVTICSKSTLIWQLLN